MKYEVEYWLTELLTGERLEKRNNIIIVEAMNEQDAQGEAYWQLQERIFEHLAKINIGKIRRIR